MSGKNIARRLAAILVADVVGYTRMMSADDSGTLATLKHHREMLFNPAVESHNGRIVKLIGDGTLVEFASAVDAVSCGLTIQRNMHAQAKSGNNLTLRIGISLGDVIIDGDDIYGDGVNIAARLEALAKPGGICIGSIVHESVVNRVDARFVDGGEVTLKNVDRPIRMWKWAPETGDETPAAGTPTITVERVDKPSIAILPFANMSGEVDQEYFSDGITEDIITDLSKTAGLLVIARNSSFAYKGKNVDIRTVASDLGVGYVLEGSIRRAGNRVRITAQLVDASNGGHLWAERYDRELTDIFAVQDEVTLQIIRALKVALTPWERERIEDTETTSVPAHDAFLRGRELILQAVKERSFYERSIDAFNRAIALDPEYGAPYAGIAMAHNVDYHNHITNDSERALEIAADFADQAIARSPHDPFGLFVAAIVATFRGRFDDAATWADAALEISPNYAPAHMARGTVEVYAGNPLSAIPQIELAIRLDPIRNQQYLHFVGTAYLTAGKYEAAAAVLKERIRAAPGTDLSRAFLASALGHLGRFDEARLYWHEMLTINPKYTFDKHVGRLPFKNQSDITQIRAGLSKAGLI